MSVAAGMTVAAAQAALPLVALENRILLGHALGLTRVGLITGSQNTVSAVDAAAINALVARRLAGEPIAYIVGKREFYGLDFAVNDAVLIPRADTELLVELALARLPPGGTLLDMGTGSGAIAVALAHSRPDAAISALDASSSALAVARANAARHGVAVRLLESDWYGALDGEALARFDVIVANPPYIASGDLHLAQGDLRFEPVDALTDHADGLRDLHTIIAGAGDHLVSGGVLLLEHGYDQAAAVRALLLQFGFSAVQSWCDLAAIERVSGGVAP
ncbi:peptide chain release factor N(5)-glutamine methyltransferase [Massilia sp. PWRC2]|uniref:peptide chain release factor N(5)-glutamine methyltransferase n=1 Tax=Massilia sp. PWRC2 TaxID=2804626 RepID=UPI003CE9D6BA